VAQKLRPGWKQALIVVNPETIVRWHRAKFSLLSCVLQSAARGQEESDFCSDGHEEVASQNSLRMVPHKSTPTLR
jgi:hypothetical protein